MVKMASILLLALLESTASQLTCEIPPCLELEETAGCPPGSWNPSQGCCICLNSCGLKEGNAPYPSHLLACSPYIFIAMPPRSQTRSLGAARGPSIRDLIKPRLLSLGAWVEARS